MGRARRAHLTLHPPTRPSTPALGRHWDLRCGPPPCLLPSVAPTPSWGTHPHTPRVCAPAQCREANVPLVTVLRQFIEEGRPLEAAFSRARSFSMKMKRKGRFVPRGMVASEYVEG